MNATTLYRRATRTLQPSAETQKREEAFRTADLAAWRAEAAVIRVELKAGADARSLYQAADRDTARGRMRGRVLVAVLRRGVEALDT